MNPLMKMLGCTSDKENFIIHKDDQDYGPYCLDKKTNKIVSCFYGSDISSPLLQWAILNPKSVKRYSGGLTDKEVDLCLSLGADFITRSSLGSDYICLWKRKLDSSILLAKIFPTTGLFWKVKKGVKIDLPTQFNGRTAVL